MKRYVLLVLLGIKIVTISSIALASSCGGRFINPITDVCWGCLLGSSGISVVLPKN